MNNTKLLLQTDKVGFVLGAALLVTLAGCIGYVDRPRAETVYVAPPAVETVVLLRDDYVYYPGYEIYYSGSRRQYIYQERGRWISRSSPRDLPIDVLAASPSVRVDFHNSPASHHAAMVRQYPRNWAPPGSNHGRKENRKDDRRDERRENNGR